MKIADSDYEANEFLNQDEDEDGCMCQSECCARYNRMTYDGSEQYKCGWPIDDPSR